MNVVEVALYGRLSGTSALTSQLAGSGNIYNGLGPDGAAFPLVVFNLQAGTEDNKSPHRARQLLIQVKGISTKNMAEAGAIDNAIDAALHEVPLTVSGYTNVSLRRESDVRYTEVGDDSKRYYHAGGIYRVRIAK